MFIPFRIRMCYMFMGVFVGVTIVQLHRPKITHIMNNNDVIKYAQNNATKSRHVGGVSVNGTKKTGAIRATRSPLIDDHSRHKDDTTIADRLYRDVRILCWVMTMPKNLELKAKHVKATWGKRCNKLLFVSGVQNDTFPAIGLNVTEGRNHLTAKSMRAFKYVYDHHFNDADWFLKADDDTYVILENLRYFLADKNTNHPVFYGQKFRTHVKAGYHSGGAGYVLSKEALRRFGKGHSQCRQDGGPEDVEIGKCMERFNVTCESTLDSIGRTRFHLANPMTHILGSFPAWYYDYVEGARGDFLSDYAISFHYVTPNNMYMMEYYVYHLRPYGIISHQQQLN